VKKSTAETSAAQARVPWTEPRPDASGNAGHLLCCASLKHTLQKHPQPKVIGLSAVSAGRQGFPARNSDLPSDSVNEWGEKWFWRSVNSCAD
jgi:hypothetical protein